jgi:hypothetical protein
MKNTSSRDVRKRVATDWDTMRLAYYDECVIERRPVPLHRSASANTSGRAPLRCISSLRARLAAADMPNDSPCERA